MSTLSLGFIFFVLIGLTLYYILPKLTKKNVQWVALLLISYVFYLAGGIGTVWYLLFTTLSTYMLSLFIGKTLSAERATPKGEEKRKKSLKRRRVLLSVAAILSNLLMLYFLKYWNFTADMIDGSGSFLPRFDILIPLGVSYYVFQSIGYVVDVYRGKVEAQTNVMKYALFVSFFPQVTQGPIGRYDALSPQLLARRELDFENIKSGISLALLGYFKKLVIADRAAVIVNEVYASYVDKNYGGAIIFLGVAMYCIQLYCDFSGGIDLVRGVAKMFGVDLAENFSRPFFATSLADFWRRWHISLGAWMRDYLFYPLSLSKPLIKLGKLSRRKIGGRLGKILPTSVATFIIYFAIGIWHGASWKYIAFGLWNGTLITSALLLEPVFIKLKTALHINEKGKLYHLFQVLRTTVIVIIGRYITRAGSFMSGLAMLKITVTRLVPSQLWDGTVGTLGLKKLDWVVALGGFALLLVYEFMLEKGKNPMKKLDSSPVVLQSVCMGALLLVIILLGAYSGDYIASEFIYQNY